MFPHDFHGEWNYTIAPKRKRPKKWTKLFFKHSLTDAFYWDRDDETRAWSKRFSERMKRAPHMGDAGDYSLTMHYLRAIEAAGTDDAKAVMAKMREMPINDFFAKNGRHPRRWPHGS